MRNWALAALVRMAIKYCRRVPLNARSGANCQLSEASEGGRYIVVSLQERDPKLLLFLHDAGIGPGQSLCVVRQNYDQTVLIELPEGSVTLGHPAAEAVWIRLENLK